MPGEQTSASGTSASGTSASGTSAIPSRIGFGEFVVLIAAMMATQALAIDAMLGAGHSEAV